MQSITIAVPYYCNPEQLKIQIATWNRYPDAAKERIKFIVVDDGSPEPAKTDWPVNIDLAMYRIKQDIPWNVTGARNLAAWQADTSHVWFVDIDHVMRPEYALALVDVEQAAKTIEIFKRYRLLDDNPDIDITKNPPLEIEERPASTYLFKMDRQEFLDLGGWDEDFAGGYGQEGILLWERAKGKGFKAVTRNDVALCAYVGGDANTALPRDKARNNKALRMKQAGVFKDNPRRLRFEWERVR